MQTVTLFGTVHYQPQSMIVALQKWARCHGATCLARNHGDRVEVTIEAEEAGAVAEGVVRFYVDWRRRIRGEC